MRFFAVLLTFISYTLMVESCFDQPKPLPTDPAARAAAKWEAVVKILEDNNIDVAEFGKQIGNYAKDPVHIEAVKQIVKDNLPEGMTDEEHNKLVAEMESLVNTNPDAGESWELVKAKITEKGGNNAPKILSLIDEYLKGPHNFTKLQEITANLAQPGADVNGIAIAVSNTLSA